MRVFVIAAVGAAALAGCAPFQHGHYTEDVAYLNSKGDPPGTPLVYQEGPANVCGACPNEFRTGCSELFSTACAADHCASRRYAGSRAAPCPASTDARELCRAAAVSTGIVRPKNATEASVAVLIADFFRC